MIQKDWREKAELLLDTVLSHVRNNNTKLKFISLWAGKEARTYLSTVDEDKKDSLKTMLDTLKDWTKFRALNQDNISIQLHSRSEENGRSVQLHMCWRLQGQTNQKFNCSWPLKLKSIPTVYLKRVQSHPE